MFCRVSFEVFHLAILRCHSTNAAVDNTEADLRLGCAGNVDTYMSGSEGAHSQDLSPLTPGHSMAQITPGGLRLYDAKGTCSMVPLEDLKQIMSKLSFSRYSSCHGVKPMLLRTCGT